MLSAWSHKSKINTFFLLWPSYNLYWQLLLDLLRYVTINLLGNPLLKKNGDCEIPLPLLTSLSFSLTAYEMWMCCGNVSYNTMMTDDNTLARWWQQMTTLLTESCNYLKPKKPCKTFVQGKVLLYTIFWHGMAFMKKKTFFYPKGEEVLKT